MGKPKPKEKIGKPSSQQSGRGSRASDTLTRITKTNFDMVHRVVHMFKLDYFPF